MRVIELGEETDRYASHSGEYYGVNTSQQKPRAWCACSLVSRLVRAHLHLSIPLTVHCPTMAAVSVPSSSSPITQVSQTPAAHTNLQPQLLTRLQLDLRGERFNVDRETIMNLPESVLLCLFPNGLVLSRQSVALSEGGEGDEDEEVYGVDVSSGMISGRNRLTYRLNSCLCSLTQSALPMYCLSSEALLMRSMEPQHHQASLLPNNTSPTHILHRKPGNRFGRTPCSQSRLLSYYVRSSNILRLRQRAKALCLAVMLQRRTKRGMRTRRCWT